MTTFTADRRTRSAATVRTGSPTASATPSAASPPGPRRADADRALRVAGPVLLPTGAIVILLGWYGAANTTRVFLQIPYLISGGLLGLGLMFAGGFLYFARWLTDLLDETRQQAGEAHATAERTAVALERIEALLRGGAAATGRRRRVTRRPAAHRRPRPVPARSPWSPPRRARWPTAPTAAWSPGVPPGLSCSTARSAAARSAGRRCPDRRPPADRRSRPVTRVDQPGGAGVVGEVGAHLVHDVTEPDLVLGVGEAERAAGAGVAEAALAHERREARRQEEARGRTGWARPASGRGRCSARRWPPSTVASSRRRTPSTSLTHAAYSLASDRALVMPLAAGICDDHTSGRFQARSSPSRPNAPLRWSARFITDSGFRYASASSPSSGTISGGSALMSNAASPGRGRHQRGDPVRARPRADRSRGRGRAVRRARRRRTRRWTGR